MASYPTVGATVPGPEEFGDLHLEHVLGAGAFGIVFRATTAKHHQTVAVKFLQAGALADPHERRALFNEVLASREITHPNVLRLLYANLDPEQSLPYVVTEFADGGTLQDRLEDAHVARTLVPLEIVQSWSLQLVGAMQAINERVIHRDLKPDNVLFLNETLKVADFGLAKLVGAATRSVTFKGGQHVLYMAPEAWDGARNDIQIDMYAAGIVLFQLSTLQFPYDIPPNDANLDAFRRMHLLQTPKSARGLRPDLPQRYSEVINRLLSKRPEGRYRSWGEAETAIQAAFTQTSAPVQAGHLPVSSLLEQADQRHRQATEQRLVANAKEKEQAEQREIDRLQQAEVVERFRGVVDTFNAQTEGPRASFTGATPGPFNLQLPYADPATVGFFAVDPPLRLDDFQVRCAALVADSKGCGFNLLLRRKPREQYGVWIVCRVRVNPISGQAHKYCDYFGFHADKMIEIQRGHHAMHVFVPEFSTDVDRYINEFVQSL